VSDLERALRELDVAWPETPDLAAAVMTRVAAREAPPRRAPRRRLILAYAAVALVVLAGGTLAVSPDARSTVLRWLGLGSVEIRRAPLEPGLGRELGLGQPLAEVPRGAPLPRALGTPDAAYETMLADGSTAVSLLYRGPPRVLVQSFRATVEPFIEKTVAMSSQVERVTVDGARGYWITGAHGFAYRSGAAAGFEEQRLADRTLLVERDGLLIRVEGALAKERAVAIARSVE